MYVVYELPMITKSFELSHANNFLSLQHTPLLIIVLNDNQPLKSYSILPPQYLIQQTAYNKYVEYSAYPLCADVRDHTCLHQLIALFTQICEM